VPANLPWNGNVSSQNGSGITLAATPGVSAKRRGGQAGAGALFNWAAHMLWRGPLLREDNVFGGLSDTMIDAGFQLVPALRGVLAPQPDLAGGATTARRPGSGLARASTSSPRRSRFSAPSRPADGPAGSDEPHLHADLPAGYHFVPST
jgi:hypothetical protein